jgi:hypothetical protein
MNRGSWVKPIVAGALALVLLAGCSSGKDTYTPPPTRPTDSAASSGPAAVPVPRKDLLVVSELPTGWTVDNKPKDAKAILPPCYTSATNTKKAKSAAEASFLAGGTAPFLIESVGYFPAAAGTAKFDYATKTLGDCQHPTFTSRKVKVTGTISTTSFPKLGDDSRAYTANLSLGGAQVTLYMLVVRKGSEVVSMCYGVIGLGTIAMLQHLANVAVDKLGNS